MYEFTNEELQAFKHALDQSAMLAVIDCNGKWNYVNELFCQGTGYSFEELRNCDPVFLCSSCYPDNLIDDVRLAVRDHRSWTGDICGQTKDGMPLAVKATITPVIDKGGMIQCYLIVMIDISERIKCNQWKHLAFHDDLTNLPNRRMLNAYLDLFIRGANKKQDELAVLFMDINNFKKINDCLGHSIGDQFLKEVGKRLLRLFPIKNRVFRQSGDEFIIILHDVDRVERQAQAIISLFEPPFKIESHTFCAAASIGISTYPTQSTERDLLIKYADIAMLNAKKMQGSHYCFFQKSMLDQFKLTKYTPL